MVSSEANLLRFAEKHIDWTKRIEAEVKALLEGGNEVAQAAVETIVAKPPIPD